MLNQTIAGISPEWNSVIQFIIQVILESVFVLCLIRWKAKHSIVVRIFAVVSIFGGFCSSSTAIMSTVGESDPNFWTALIPTILFGVGLIIVAIYKMIYKTIIFPLKDLIRYSQEVAKGNLNAILPENNRKDEIGLINRAFRSMGNSLSGIVSQIQSTSKELFASVEQMSQGVSSMTEASDSIVNSQQQIAKGTQGQAQDTTKAQKQIQELNKGIQEISTEVRSLLEISDNIKMIADQTNMIALNASIESARAGEAGRGFSVVAENIRKLSEDSKRAMARSNINLERIKSITSIQTKATETAVMSIHSINITAEQTSSATEEVSASSEELSGVLSHFGSNILAIREMAKTLEESINQFQLLSNSKVLEESAKTEILEPVSVLNS